MESVEPKSEGKLPFTPIQRVMASAVAVIVACVFAEASLPAGEAETWQWTAIGLVLGHAAIEAFGSKESRDVITHLFQKIREKGGS